MVGEEKLKEEEKEGEEEQKEEEKEEEQKEEEQKEKNVQNVLLDVVCVANVEKENHEFAVVASAQINVVHVAHANENIKQNIVNKFV